ncbi:RND transporter [Pseudomonas syringae]|uniref:RND transporter n=1 Tax=Pseudomonas syringae TaxID=317 RepID=A0A244EVL5_PSESX|nr:efflux RND transporter permease subunit [Pseudomonas syringae]MCI3945710.1 efflux RND transporter permease subunit [Pseudomonas syringae]OUM08458.1 RND transporter [Pseudomonas syringae]
MTLSSLSIRYPVPAIMLFILLGVLGCIGLQRLGIQDFPDVDLPTVTISASLEGAAPEQLETEVARKLEDRLSSLRLLKHVSTTITSGSVEINVSFAIEKDGNEALNEVRNAVDSAMAELPASLDTPSVSRLTVHDTPVLTYFIDAPGMDEEALSWFVDNELSKHLLKVKGVAQVVRVGGVEREVQVDLNPAMMAGLGLSVADIETPLKAMQIDNSGGLATLGSGRMAVRTLGRIDDPQALGAIDVPVGDGRSFALHQLATIRDHHAERQSMAFLDGRPVTGVQVIRSLGFSDVSMAAEVRKAVAAFVSSQPGIRLTEVSDSSAPILENYHDSMNLLYEGILLAVLVVWWFLRDLRAMLIVATALPLSIIPTFGLMYFAGFTLNTVSLLALALIIGILVDDAIVEVENIARHLRMGKSPRQAAMEAADEIGLAVIATTVTLVAVFLPTAFMGGVAGRLFVQFGVTASAALLFSLLVARLLTPMMAAVFLKPVNHVERDGWLMQRYLVWIHRSLEWRKTSMALAALFFAGSLALIGFLPTSFLPAQDIARSTITLELPPGTALQQTADLARQASDRVRPLQGVRHVFAVVGSAGSEGGEGAALNKATLTVELVRRQERDVSQTALEARMREALRSLPGARISVGGDGNGEKLDIVLASEDGALLERTALDIEPQLRQLNGVGNIASSAALQTPEVQLTPDYVRAAQLGITSQQIADTLRLATYGNYSSALGKINLSQRQVDLRVRMEPGLRSDMERIAQLRVKGSDGQVALASLGELSMGSGPAQIDRLDRQRNVTLSIELNGRSLGEVMDQVRRLPGIAHLPAGVKLVEQGEVQLMSELFGSFGLTMAIGVFCIYAVLVLLFHDFLQPATILSALPLSLGGALLALLACDLSFSLSSIIGLLMLMGIVTKNSILLVDYAILARRDLGMNRYQAVVDACHKRARPILMTTIAMGAGMLPTAIGVGADPGFRQPMAVVVIGGLITSTLLSLLVVPVIFTYVDDLLQLFKRFTKSLAHNTSGSP